MQYPDATLLTKQETLDAFLRVGVLAHVSKQQLSRTLNLYHEQRLYTFDNFPEAFDHENVGDKPVWLCRAVLAGHCPQLFPILDTFYFITEHHSCLCLLCGGHHRRNYAHSKQGLHFALDRHPLEITFTDNGENETLRPYGTLCKACHDSLPRKVKKGSELVKILEQVCEKGVLRDRLIHNAQNWDRCRFDPRKP